MSSSFDWAFWAALYGVAETARIAPSSMYRDSDEWVHVVLSVSKNDV